MTKAPAAPNMGAYMALRLVSGWTLGEISQSHPHCVNLVSNLSVLNLQSFTPAGGNVPFIWFSVKDSRNDMKSWNIYDAFKLVEIAELIEMF